MLDRELAEAVILGHYRSPKNTGVCDGDGCCTGDTTNPACGDEITVSLEIDADGTLSCLRFEGQGCAVSQAGASLVTSSFEGKTAEATRAKLEAFLAMMEGNGDPESALETVGEIAFLGVLRDNPARVVCATLAARLAKRLLEG